MMYRTCPAKLQDIKGEERRRHQAEDPALPAAQAQEEKTMKSELLMYSRHSPWPLHPLSRHLSIFTFTTTFCVPFTQSTTSELQFKHNACREFANKTLRRKHLSFGCCCSTFNTFLTLNTMPQTHYAAVITSQTHYAAVTRHYTTDTLGCCHYATDTLCCCH